MLPQHLSLYAGCQANNGSIVDLRISGCSVERPLYLAMDVATWRSWPWRMSPGSRLLRWRTCETSWTCAADVQPSRTWPEWGHVGICFKTVSWVNGFTIYRYLFIRFMLAIICSCRSKDSYTMHIVMSKQVRASDFSTVFKWITAKVDHICSTHWIGKGTTPQKKEDFDLLLRRVLLVENLVQNPCKPSSSTLLVQNQAWPWLSLDLGSDKI